MALLAVLLAAAVYWFAQLSLDEKPPHSHSLPTKPVQSVPETSVPESMESSTKLDDPVITDTATSSDDSIEVRCASSPSLLLPLGLADIPGDLPPVDYHEGASNDALIERIRQGDGYAEQVYANKHLVRLVNEYFDTRGFVGRDEQAERWLREFDEMVGTLISAVQKGSGRSATNLGFALAFPGPRNDPIKSAAWYLVEQRMGGNTFASLQSQGIIDLTPAELETSELLADHLIEEHDLWFLDQSLRAELENVMAQDCVEN